MSCRPSSPACFLVYQVTCLDFGRIEVRKGSAATDLRQGGLGFIPPSSVFHL